MVDSFLAVVLGFSTILFALTALYFYRNANNKNKQSEFEEFSKKLNESNKEEIDKTWKPYKEQLQRDLDILKTSIEQQKAIAIKNSERFNIWNLGSGKGTSVFQIINTFETILEKKFNIKIKPRRKGDLSEYWADIRKAKNQLNWKPQKTTKDIVLDTIRYSEFLNSK